MRKATLLFSTLIILFLSACGGIKDYKSTSQAIGHVIWDNLLKKHVSAKGQVDYKGFQQDSVQLKRYLGLLENHHPNKVNWTSDERLAYWINAYNAYTVKMIVDNYPVKSIKDIKNGIPFVNTVWDIKFIKIESATYDLNNIEHGIIRKQFEEPRIHFAVNCASISCPSLRNEAYVAERLDEQLREQTRIFLSDASKNQVHQTKPKLSKIFSWFKGDFGNVIKFINQYSDEKIDKKANIDYLDYDWNLNE